MKPDTSLPPHVTHVATYEAFALYCDEETRQTFIVPLTHHTVAGIRAAYHEARSDFYERNPDEIERDAPGVLCCVAIFAGLSVLVGAVVLVLYFTR